MCMCVCINILGRHITATSSLNITIESIIIFCHISIEVGSKFIN